MNNQTKQNKTKQNKTKQNKTKQNKTKQNKTKQNKTKQNKTKPLQRLVYMNRVMRKYIRITIFDYKYNAVRFLKSTMYKQRM